MPDHMTSMRMYKVVELSTVTDDMLEDALNSWTSQGWIFESLHFAMNSGSKRPAMAFIFFTRPEEDRDTRGEVDIKGGTVL